MNNNNTTIVSQYSGILASTEVGLGSYLHAWRIPFSGQFLSLNQIFFMALATQKSATRRSSLQISIIVSVLKSLSPAGKKLTPMLAIYFQGLLFYLATAIFGVNRVGVLLGGIFSSLWAFIQPFILYYFIFGKELFYLFQYFFEKINKVLFIGPSSIYLAVGLLIGLKILAAIMVIFFSYSKLQDKIENQLKKISNIQMFYPDAKNNKELSLKEKFILIYKDLSRPYFLVPLLAMCIFFYITDVNIVKSIWYSVRVIAFAIILFYIIRFLPLERWIIKIIGDKSELAISLNQTLKNLKNKA